MKIPTCISLLITDFSNCFAKHYKVLYNWYMKCKDQKLRKYDKKHTLIINSIISQIIKFWSSVNQILNLLRICFFSSLSCSWMRFDWIFGGFGPLVMQNKTFIYTHHLVLINILMAIYFGCLMAQLINQENNWEFNS